MHTHCLIPQARSQLQERGGAGTRETLTRVGTKTRGGRKGGCHHCREERGTTWSIFLLMRKVEGPSGPHGEGGVAKHCGKNMEALKGGECQIKEWGPLAMGEIKQLRRWLKPGYTRESPPPPPPLMFALAGVLGDSFVAMPLIGAASPGNPNYRPWRDGCACGGELSCAPPSTSPVFHCSTEGHHPEAPEMFQTNY